MNEIAENYMRSDKIGSPSEKKKKYGRQHTGSRTRESISEDVMRSFGILFVLTYHVSECFHIVH